MAERSVNLKSVAAHLGLTVSTVSRALNNYSDINAETRERVKRAADELGYRPNQNARRLSIGTSETVCYLMPRQIGANAQPFVAQLLAGLGEALNKRNWDLLVSQADASVGDLAGIERLVRSGRVAGLVISRPLKNDPRIKLLQELDCPFVVHGRTAQSEGYAWYDVDGEDAFVTATNHLAQLGHRRIGFITAPLQFQFSQERMDGFYRGLKHNGLPIYPELVQIAEFSDEGGSAAAGLLMDLPNPPTALLCVTDMMALGALEALHARGIVPGQDVTVIGYDGLHFGKHSNPPLTTMAQPQAHAGRRLGDILLSIIDGADPTKFQELQRAHLVQRMTDGPVKLNTGQNDVSVREEPL
ncbi:MAG: LacI family DNA-binding transcriptional regulator [Pseudomonadota bacterium]